MSKLISLDEQLENIAKKWFFGFQIMEYREDSEEIFEEYKQDIIKKYLKVHPKIEEQYKTKKKVLNTIKVSLVVLGATLAVTIPTKIYTYSETNQKTEKTIDIQIDNDKLEKDFYQKFFDQVKEIENTEKREELITNKTKEIIVEFYNKKHSGNPIDVNMLETFVLNEYVLKKMDKLGNYTYHRVSQNVQYEKTEEQELTKIGDIYDFIIDGKTVAVFDKNAESLLDENVPIQNMDFQKVVPLMQKAQELKYAYKYENTKEYREKIEQEYMQIAEKILEKHQNKEKEEIQL